MGYIVELNTLLRPPETFDFNHIELHKRYSVTLERERAFPLRIAILFIDKNWKFYGYCRAHSIVVENKKTTILFEMLTFFSPEEQLLYQKKFIEAGKLTGEIV